MSRSILAFFAIDFVLVAGCGSAPSDTLTEEPGTLEQALDAARPAGWARRTNEAAKSSDGRVGW